MNFWKENVTLRMTLMTVFFVLGMVLVVSGWKMKGSLTGLGIMVVGVILLLTALLVYNKAYEDPKKDRR